MCMTKSHHFPPCTTPSLSYASRIYMCFVVLCAGPPACMTHTKRRKWKHSRQGPSLSVLGLPTTQSSIPKSLDIAQTAKNLRLRWEPAAQLRLHHISVYSQACERLFMRSVALRSRRRSTASKTLPAPIISSSLSYTYALYHLRGHASIQQTAFCGILNTLRNKSDHSGCRIPD